MTTDIPLCVDLDGTLVKTDTLIESFAKDVIADPFRAVSRTRLLKRGKASYKQALSESTTLDASTLPYNQQIVDYVRNEKEKRKIVLVTGADRKIAQSVCDHVELFDEVYASDGETNLTNTNKQALLEKEFGKGGFDYIGNDEDDKVVWSSARKALVVAPKGRFLQEVSSKYSPAKVFVTPKATIRDWLKFARVHQWSKNLLIFVPFFLDHRFSQSADFAIALISFLAFCLLASATYIVNDFLDIESDRQNTTKSVRALASGIISIPQGLLVASALFLCACVLSLFLPYLFVLTLAVYLVMTLLYSFYLKKIVMIDVCTLAALHTLRIIAGTVAIGAIWSFWLLGFSMFLFLSLALAKRVSELENIKAENKANPTSRDYTTSDISTLTSAGISAGFISVLVIALYVNSGKVTRAYAVPEILWLICPLLLYWIGRLWVITSRGMMHEDPIVFALKDRTSIVIMAMIGCIFCTAILID